MVRPDATSGYTASVGLYNWPVSAFTIGDVIRKARVAKRWSQTKLGTVAASYQLGEGTLPINKSTVSKVEKDPYTSEFGTVWRLLAALNLTFGDVERQIGKPFTERRKEEASRHSARDAGRAKRERSEAAEKRGRARTGQT